MNLNNSVALITGGSAGIGRAIAKTLADSGAHVAITGRDKKRLDDAAQALGVFPIQADVSKEADVLRTYRELLKPVHKRAIEWAHARGVKAHLHSCGDVNPFVPELIEIGLDALNPLEVKAGMDPIALKKKFGDKLVFHGGINAVLWDKPDQIEAEMRRVVPAVARNGGYIFSSDHSVPSTVSLEAFRRIINLAKTLGAY